MSTTAIIVVAVAVVVVVALVVVAGVANSGRRHRALQGQFGPEYDRAVDASGSQKQAEVDLRGRLERRNQVELHPLSPGQRDRYLQDWRQVQVAFVDAPGVALGQADTLITTVMLERGYPMQDFDAQASLVSVDHPQVVEHYRRAHGIYTASYAEAVSTEDMRQALVSYRALFAQLLEDNQATVPAGRTPGGAAGPPTTY